MMRTDARLARGVLDGWVARVDSASSRRRKVLHSLSLSLFLFLSLTHTHSGDDDSLSLSHTHTHTHTHTAFSRRRKVLSVASGNLNP